jgi:hypothetical protein
MHRLVDVSRNAVMAGPRLGELSQHNVTGVYIQYRGLQEKVQARLRPVCRFFEKPLTNGISFCIVMKRTGHDHSDSYAAGLVVVAPEGVPALLTG